jgi:inorganic triphosphatase YgiF
MTEIELKFDLPAKDHAAFRRLPALSGAHGRTVRIRSTYFDTPDFGLRDREMALRLRRAGRRWVQTLKAGRSGAGGLHARDEWEVDRPGPTLDLAALAGTPFDESGDAGARLGEVFTVDLRRTTWDVEVSPGNRVEIALDRGEVRHGDRAEAVSEVEIESRSGDPGAVFEFAQRLIEPEGDNATALPLRPSSVTKAQRGYRLALGEIPAPVKARPVPLDATLSPAQAARAIAREALDQLQANEAGARDCADPEFLHQFRVALRRLRSALSVFRRALGPDAQALEAELRWIARLTGPVRDWDVFEAATLPPLLEAFGEEGPARSARRRARSLARVAREHLRAALVSPRYAHLLLEAARWLSQASRDPPPPPDPLPEFARRVIRKRHKRLLADARRLSLLGPEERHALRLDAKRLRYAIEGLATLFKPKRLEARVQALSDIQDDLGRANDAAVAARLFAQLSPPAALAQFARGWFAAQAQASVAGFDLHVRRLESAQALKAR